METDCKMIKNWPFFFKFFPCILENSNLVSNAFPPPFGREKRWERGWENSPQSHYGGCLFAQSLGIFLLVPLRAFCVIEKILSQIFSTCLTIHDILSD